MLFAEARAASLHLVVAGIGIRRQMADIGDVDDVGEGVEALPARQRPAQRVGEDVGAQIAEMGDNYRPSGRS
jgi:hypothetical protein